MQDYSQSGEQKIILDYFGHTPGTALDAGANDGISLSNSHALHHLGWNLCCVEPSPAAFARLAELYDGTNHVLVNAAITETDGPVEFYDSGTHLKKGDVALLSTTKSTEMDRWKKSGEVFTKTVVRGITFQTLLKETGLKQFDFITIDAEGLDWQILKQIDLRLVGCRMLCVEVNQGGDSHFINYAARHGMKLRYKNWENRVFAL